MGQGDRTVAPAAFLSPASPDAITDRTMGTAEERPGLSALARQAYLPRVAEPPSVARGAESFPVLYGLLRILGAPTLRSLCGLRVSGLEHLPASGPFIVAANHHNYLDAVVLGVALPRPISFLVMPRVYHATALHPLLHRHMRSIPINVERPGPSAIKRSLHALSEGRVVGIFPEGPFSREGRLVAGQPGAAAIALRAGVPVLPAGIRGTYEALVGRRFYLPRRHPLSVSFGPVLQVGGPRRGRLDRMERAALTRRIMAAIALLVRASS